MRRDKLRQSAEKAYDLIFNDKNSADGLELLRSCQGELAARGQESGYALWAEGVALDWSGSLEESIDAFSRALAIDPLNPSFGRSMDVIIDKAHDAVQSGEEDEGFTHDRRMALYRLLVERGHAGTDDHVAAAVMLMHTGRRGKALVILEALSVLQPADQRISDLLARAQALAEVHETDDEIHDIAGEAMTPRVVQ